MYVKVYYIPDVRMKRSSKNVCCVQVNISINESPVKELQMKLGEQGEAFFVIDMDEDEDTPSQWITSPLPSRPSTPKAEEELEET